MSEQKLINAFHEVLEGLHAGQSLEELLAAYPDLADELRPMLQTSSVVPNAHVDSGEVRAMRSRLDKQFESQLAALDFPKKASRRPLLAFVASLALVFLGLWIFLPRSDNQGAIEVPLTQSSSETVTVSPTTAIPSNTPSASPSANPTNAIPENTKASCTPRTDWQIYQIQSGDTLSEIARNSGTSPEALIFANCLENPFEITVGQHLYVPRLWESAVPTKQGNTNSGSGSNDDDDDDD